MFNIPNESARRHRGRNVHVLEEDVAEDGGRSLVGGPDPVRVVHRDEDGLFGLTEHGDILKVDVLDVPAPPALRFQMDQRTCRKAIAKETHDHTAC